MEITLDNDGLHVESPDASLVLDFELYTTPPLVFLDSEVVLEHGAESSHVMNVFDKAIRSLGTEEVQAHFKRHMRSGVNMFSSLGECLSGQRSSVNVEAKPPFTPSVSLTTSPRSSASASASATPMSTKIRISFFGPNAREFTETNGYNVMQHVVGGLLDLPTFARPASDTNKENRANNFMNSRERSLNVSMSSDDVLDLANKPLPVVVGIMHDVYKMKDLCDVFVARGELLIESGRLAWSEREPYDPLDRGTDIHNVGYKAEDIGHVTLDGTLCFYKGVVLSELCKSVLFSELNAVIPNMTRVFEFAALRQEGMSNAEFINECKQPQNNAAQGIMISEIAGVPLRVFLRKHKRQNVIVSVMRQFLWTAYSVMCWTGTCHSDVDIRNFMVASSNDARQRTLTYIVGTRDIDRVEIDIRFSGMTAILKWIDVGANCISDKTVQRNVENLRAGRVDEAVNLLNEGHNPHYMFHSIHRFANAIIGFLKEPDMHSNTELNVITSRLDACSRAALDMSVSSTSNFTSTSNALQDVHMLDRMLTQGVKLSNASRSSGRQASSSRSASKSRKTQSNTQQRRPSTSLPVTNA
jgi:hypothetical protein